MFNPLMWKPACWAIAALKHQSLIAQKI